MAVIKCKMCGGDLEVTDGARIIQCEYCGTNQTLPKLTDDKKVNLYDRANHFRRNNEFDKAMSIYEKILNEDNSDSESYWSLVLCRYGIEYVEDPATHKRVPTVNRAQFTSIYDDEDYKSAIKYADISQKIIYEDEAKAINEIQKGILEISQKEEPFDVFICYKETDPDGRRTQDSVLATELYHELTREGLKVFFSRITLEDKLGTAYEPYIFAALNSAKAMVVVGTRPEYFNAVWVKNEWSRFLALIKNGARKVLIPAYRDMDPYDLPEEFSHLQAQDMSKLGFMQDLVRGIKKIADNDKIKQTAEKETVTVGVNSNTDSLLERVFMFLEDGDWTSADEYCEKVLDIDPKCAEAYLGKLMTELHIKNREDLKNCEKPFSDNNNYQKAIRFGNDALKTEIESYIKCINDRNKERIKAFRKVQEPHCIRNMQTHISAGNWHTVGLKSDGTVVAAGDNRFGQCEVQDWKDIVAISARYDCTAGLKSDGTVVAVGKNYFGGCEVQDWKDIVAISAGGDHTVGLKADGTVCAVGYNGYGGCEVQDWKDIVAISAGSAHTVGLKADGTVVATKYTGEYNYGQCEVQDWKDIVAISAGHDHTVGLKSDGTVVAVGKNEYGKCEVRNWKDIVAISAEHDHTVGLKSDGTVVAVGSNNYGRCKVQDWSDILLPINANTIEELMSLKAQKRKEAHALIEQKRIEKEKRAEAERARIAEEKQKETYRSAGLCQHCGGSFKGIFSKICTQCGKKKDY